MNEYLKCYYCGKETDSKDSRPWIQVIHLSCKREMMEKQNWVEDDDHLGMHKVSEKK